MTPEQAARAWLASLPDSTPAPLANLAGEVVTLGEDGSAHIEWGVGSKTLTIVFDDASAEGYYADGDSEEWEAVTPVDRASGLALLIHLLEERHGH